MKTIPYTNARAKMVALMEQINDNHEPIEITRRGKRSVVMMGYEDFKAIEMTMEMMRDPQSAKELILNSMSVAAE